MQEKIEFILKEIHVTFSKCPVYEDTPDKIVVNKRIMFELLEKLNETVYEMMDRYEVTVQSKDRAEREMKKKGENIILDATIKAEDVYAASVLYTEDALNKLEKMMDETKQRFEEICNTFAFDFEGEKRAIKNNKIELEGQLNELIETKKYLKIIEEQNKDEEKVKKVVVAGAKKNKEIRTTYDEEELQMNVKVLDDEPKIIPQVAIQVDLDAEYFKWKNNEEVETVTRDSMSKAKKLFFGKK